jgi:hypothetical protein
MGRVKNQHYVPQFYLKGFAPDGKSLFVFDKIAKRIFRAGTPAIASEHLFYDIPDPEKGIDEEQVVEKTFADLEGDYAIAIREVVAEVEADNRFTTGSTERYVTIAHFVATQFCRTREFRNTSVQLQQAMWEKIAKTVDRMREDYAVVGQTVAPLPELDLEAAESSKGHAGFMFESKFVDNVVSILMSHIWCIGANGTDVPFFTSDAPVILYPHRNDPAAGGGTGFGAKGIEVVLPLSPKYVLLMRERSHFGPIMEQFKQPEGGVLAVQPRGVKLFNSFQTANSHRHIYSPTGAFESVQEILDAFPILSDPNRQRYTVGG